MLLVVVEHVGTGDAIDDLVDIYKELWEGRDLYQRGFVVDAIWHWSWSYRNHWAAHLMDLQRCLHEVMNDWIDEDD